MAIKNKTVEILGEEAKISAVQIYPQADGNCVIVVAGNTKDNEGRAHSLKEAQIGYIVGENDAMEALLALCLGAIRKTNGLEDAALALEPGDAQAKLAADRAAKELVADKIAAEPAPPVP